MTTLLTCHILPLKHISGCLPNATLSGYHSIIAEEERQTENRRELDEYEQDVLNQKLKFLLEHLDIQPEVRLWYFQADMQKSGGAYILVSGIIKKMDYLHKTLMLEDGTEIRIEDINSIECILFPQFEE